MGPNKETPTVCQMDREQENEQDLNNLKRGAFVQAAAAAGQKSERRCDTHTQRVWLSGRCSQCVVISAGSPPTVAGSATAGLSHCRRPGRGPHQPAPPSADATPSSAQAGGKGRRRERCKGCDMCVFCGFLFPGTPDHPSPCIILDPESKPPSQTYSHMHQNRFAGT